MPMTLPRFFQLLTRSSYGKYVGFNEKNVSTFIKLLSLKVILPKRAKILRADVSKYRPEVYKSEKSNILKKLHKVALGKLLT